MRRSWKTRSRRALLILALIGLPIGWAVHVFLERPLGPTLAYPEAQAASGQSKLQVSIIANLPVLPTPADVSSAPAQPLCRGPRVMDILAIGSDYRYDNYLYGLSDVIKVVRVDFVTPRIMLLDFPRDLYVQIPDIAQHGGITRGKLNQPFLYGNPGLGYYDGPGAGPGLLARTLDLNYGERPDHYIAVNMDVFVKLIDAVGGVNVDLPDWELGKSPGIHHMDGPQALDFARGRPDGTFERTDRQDLVLAAFWQKLRDPAVIGSAPAMIAAFQGSVETDLTPDQLQQLSCLAGKMPRENVEFLNWPAGMFTGTRVNDPVLGYTFIWDVDNALMRTYVAAFNDGLWPDALINKFGSGPAGSQASAP
jgi:LCP family protein required for cell wall assembly